MPNNTTERAIRKWVRKQVRENAEDYFDGPYTMDWANSTKLGAECSDHFNFEEGSEGDEACFEYALIALENLCRESINA